MQLHLTDEEAAELQDLVEARLGNLYVEISHTDNREYRQGLRDRRERLRRVLAELKAPTAAPDPAPDPAT
jgi:hypothetical protein